MLVFKKKPDKNSRTIRALVLILLLDHISQKPVDLSQIEILILDEADRTHNSLQKIS
ncbi:MAG: hypothetical protein OQL19_22350 [Gammaproteobacteria bacterium]|nr:hypothetical protein [Gammaproteobacteria bacterium]